MAVGPGRPPAGLVSNGQCRRLSSARDAVAFDHGYLTGSAALLFLRTPVLHLLYAMIAMRCFDTGATRCQTSSRRHANLKLQRVQLEVYLCKQEDRPSTEQLV